MDDHVIANAKPNVLLRVWRFYADGFRSMTVGKKLWALIIIKIIILFVILKPFFFPNIMEERYDNDEQRSSALRSIMTEKTNN